MAVKKQTGQKRRAPSSGRKPSEAPRVRMALRPGEYVDLLGHAQTAGRTPGRQAAFFVRQMLAFHAVPDSAQVEGPPVGCDPWANEPEALDLEAELGAVMAFKVRLGGQVAVIREADTKQMLWVVWYFPPGDNQSATYVEASSLKEAEVIARQTALAQNTAEDGGHCLL